MLKVNADNEYKAVERVYSGSTEIDKILDKNGNVLFSVSKEVEGTPALTYTGKEETNLKNYRIYGNTVNGESMGNRNGNLWNEIYDEDGKPHYVPIKVEDGEYTLSTTTPNGGVSGGPPAATIFLLAGNVNTGASTTDNGCWLNNPKTVQSIDGYVTIAYEVTESFGEQCYPWNNNTMLNSGSTALPYEPYVCKVPVTVEGKNLLQNTATSRTTRGITFTVNTDGSITCSGIVTSGEYADLAISGVFLGDIDILENGNYIVSCANGSNNASLIVGNSKGEVRQVRAAETNISANLTWAILRIYQANPAITLYPMIRKADIEDDTYEPYHAPVTTNLYLPEQIKMVGDEAEYVDYKEQKQHRVRKNLVQTIATSQTINGITFTVNANGSVTCNGTNHGNNPIIFELNNPDVVFPEGVYITSGCPAGGSITGGYKIQYFNGSSWNYELGSGSTFTLSGNLKYRSRILISKDVTVTNLTFYPMLRLASIEDDTYEPYIEDTELDVAIPALPILSGTNTLSVGTEVQPSNVYLKGRIKEIS